MKAPQRTCWHEAGHAIMLALCDRKFKYIQVVPSGEVEDEGDLGDGRIFMLVKCAGVAAEMLLCCHDLREPEVTHFGFYMLGTSGNLDYIAIKKDMSELDEEAIKSYLLDAHNLLEFHRSSLKSLADRLGNVSGKLYFEDVKMLLPPALKNP